MQGCRIAALGGLLLVSQAVSAGQDVSGMTCGAGELSWVTGPVFSAMCTGDLRIDSSVVITADESITLLAAGFLWQGGTLIAPKIVLTAGANLIFTGGLFSGSPDYFPDVQAQDFAGSPAAGLRVFSDLVPRLVIDPVYGASEMQSAVVIEAMPHSWTVHTTVSYDMPVADDVEPLVFTAFPGSTRETAASSVPEPSRLALFAAGLGLVAWKRRAMGNLSRTAHARSNPKVTLEN